MIGKQISYTGSDFTYAGVPVQLGYTLDGQASQVQVSIKDNNGTIIKTIKGTDLTKGDHSLTWNGLDQNNNAVQPGQYKISVSANGVASTGIAVSPFIRSEVTGVDLNDSGNPIMNTKAGDIDFSKILGVFPSTIL
jgi:flagellar basal-body rod modification protein FlgD